MTSASLKSFSTWIEGRCIRFTDCYLVAAQRLGLSYEVEATEDTVLWHIEHDGKALEVENGSLKLNSVVACALANNKTSAGMFLEKAGVPTPRSRTFLVDADLDEVLADAGDPPWVIKPVYGLGGRAVSVNLHRRDELTAAIQRVRDLGRDRCIIERYVRGHDYRILMIDGHVLDVLQRLPASIVGNGTHTIEALIEAKNAARHAYHPRMRRIEIDAALHDELDRQGLTLTSMPTAGRKIVLRRVCNFGQGGDLRRIPLQDIGGDLMEMFQRAQKALNLRFCGIDLIAPDLRAPLDPEALCVNEMNYNPGIDMHCLAAPDGIQTKIPEQVLCHYFGLEIKDDSRW